MLASDNSDTVFVTEHRKHQNNARGNWLALFTAAVFGFVHLLYISAVYTYTLCYISTTRSQH